MKKLVLSIIVVLLTLGIVIIVWRKSPRTRKVVKSSPAKTKQLAARIWEYIEDHECNGQMELPFKK